MEQLIFACKAKRLSWLFKKSIVEWIFLNNSRILIIFLFKLLDELWHDYNAIFYLLNNLVDSIVSVFFGFYLVFFYTLVDSFIILLFIYLFIYYLEGHKFSSPGYFVLTLIK